MVVGARRVAVAERGELRFDGVGGKGRLADGQVDYGLEQRAVEEALVQVGHHAAQLGQGSLHFFDGGMARGGLEAGRAREPAQPLLIVRGGQLVGALEALQLEAVLEQAEELVGADEFVGVLAADVAADHERVERLDRVRLAQALVDTAVDELQELDGELHIAQAAFAEFKLALTQRLGHVGEHAPAHRLYIFDEGFALGGLPHQGRKLFDVALTQRDRTGQRPGLE